MIIRVAGQEYRVTNTKRKSRSLGSLTDLTVENSESSDSKNIPRNNNANDDNNCDESKQKSSAEPSSKCIVVVSDDVKNSKENVNRNFNLSKSKSECNPFEHKKRGKIIRLTERPKAQGNLFFCGCLPACLHDDALFTL